MNYGFNSGVMQRGGFRNDWPEIVVKCEPMFFNASLDFALDSGGPITQAFINALPRDWSFCDAVFDSRVHMLMPGWYPCIPGYHHDDVARDATGQPNYDDMPYRSEHLMGLVNGDICPTVFALGYHELPKIESGIVYKQWHDIVVEQIRAGQLNEYEAPSGRLIEFDWRSMHTGQKAKRGGWRWFGRLSRNTIRTKTKTDEIRRQVQVYLDNPTEGW